ncbi:hypothetical protein [Mycobacterium sp.]|uniref:TetR/AcrR family transcriptional regulator n=1 Tax=Mycobacterium sp. TaxID=1785 RepID=UPI0031D539FB
MGTQPRQGATRSIHRKRSVVHASATVLRRRGFDAVNYRSVADEANISEQTVRAFFRTADDLRAAGLQYMLHGWIRQAEYYCAQLPNTLNLHETARLIVEVVTANPATNEPFSRPLISAVYERYLQAGKHSELRLLIAEYNAVLSHLVGRVLLRNGRQINCETCRAVLAVVDGAVIYELAAGSPPVKQAIEMLEFAIPKLCG